MATVIAVANQKGGVGKTTTTANLGAALARRGCRVLLVDLDPQGNLTSAFGLEKDVQQTVAESLLDRRVPLPVVPVANGSSGNFDGAKHLSVVPAAVGLASAEAQLMNKLGRELRLPAPPPLEIVLRALEVGAQPLADLIREGLLVVGECEVHRGYRSQKRPRPARSSAARSDDSSSAVNGR